MEPELNPNCRPEAIQYFRQCLPVLNTTRGLLHAAFAISLHALDDARPERVDAAIKTLSDRVRGRYSESIPQTILAHLHAVMFEEERFSAPSEANVPNPLHSYVPAVLELRGGTPSTLALIYKAVGESLGLQIEGVLARGRFLVRVYDGEGWLFIDPAQKGRVLTVGEACELIGGTLCEGIQPDVRHLPAANHPQWVARILINLVQLFDVMESGHDRRAMNEFLSLLELPQDACWVA